VPGGLGANDVERGSAQHRPLASGLLGEFFLRDDHHGLFVISPFDLANDGTACGRSTTG
jgi:hypothetical protein